MPSSCSNLCNIQQMLINSKCLEPENANSKLHRSKFCNTDHRLKG
jgi:hypothetical protein